MGIMAVVSPTASSAATYTPRSFGELDCNNQSPAQRSIKTDMLCTDVRGIEGINNKNTWGGRFYDNGYYIGHDEPDMTFLSKAPGSGDSVTWTEKLGSDPKALPTTKSPGSDVSHYFELTPAPWFSMAMCDSNSYPQTPCTPESDKNKPACEDIAKCPNSYPGGGSAFMEMQFYPPGFAPFDDAISCDNSHWCAALTIDSLECTVGFASCNSNCEEPVNFAFIQTDGVPTGPPNPQSADLNTFTPNHNTLLMNPGDKVTVSMSDAPAPGGGSAFEVVVNDLTTGKSGFMQASATNGFQNTSIVNCSGTPYNFQPEYSSAAPGNIVPWAALQTDISTEFETGHWISCNSLQNPGTVELAPGVFDTYYNTCNGVYERTASEESPEVSDAYCYPAGDTHGTLATAPDETTGCMDDLFQNGDLDFDGSPYWTEWPTATTPNIYPASFVQQLPTTNGSQYPGFFLQTDTALSESTCTTSGAGCAIPPPNAPGKFYPYWSRVPGGGGCVIEFGNVSAGNTYGKDAQYGTDQEARIGYPEFEGPVMSNTSC